MDYTELKERYLSVPLTPTEDENVSDYIDEYNTNRPEGTRALSRAEFGRRAVRFFLDNHSQGFQEDGE